MTVGAGDTVFAMMHVNGEGGSASVLMDGKVLAADSDTVDVELGDMVFTYDHADIEYDGGDLHVPQLESGAFTDFASRSRWEAERATGPPPPDPDEALLPGCVPGCDRRGKIIHDPACPHA